MILVLYVLRKAPFILLFEISQEGKEGNKKKNLLNEYKWYKISSINHTRAAIAGREYIYNSLINKDTLEIGLRCVHDLK